MNEFKEARESLKWTQKYMSEEIGIPIRTIQDWESERRTPPEWQKRLVLKELRESKMERDKMEKAEMEENRNLYDFGVGEPEEEDFGSLEYFDTLTEAIDNCNFDNQVVYILYKESGDVDNILYDGILTPSEWYGYGVALSDVM